MERSDQQITTIVADEVWTETIPQRSLDKRRHETIFDGEPWDLRVLDSWLTRASTSRSVRATTHYLLTPSNELRPIISAWKRRKILRQVKLRLRPGRRLAFVTLERREIKDDAECTYRELAARERHVVLRKHIGVVDDRQLDAVDDLLAIVSFASRHRVACLAVDTSTDDGHHFRFYRRHVSRPSKNQQDRDDEVIDHADFYDFLPRAHEAFLATGPDELVRHSLHVSVPGRDRTVESSFASLFAAVESLVLWFRRQHDLEFAVMGEDWARLKPDLLLLLRQHPVFTGDPERKERGGFVRANLTALQRVPFNTAFRKFCSHFAVPTDDLWPMASVQGDVGLADIRNRVVHGSTFDRRQFNALATAADHLQWLLERMLLRVLDWPIDRSNVSGERLARMRAAYQELGDARASMRTVPSPPTELN